MRGHCYFPDRLLVLAALLLAAVARCGGRAATPIAAQPITPAQRIERGRAAAPPDAALSAAAYEASSVAEEDIAAAPARDEGAGDEAPSPPPGARHILRRGQTLYSVARIYGVPLAMLMRVNGIADPRKVPADQPLLIPGTKVRTDLPEPEDATAPHLTWPLQGPVTARFGWRGRHAHHEGLDIDGRTGDVILAAASGTVRLAGMNGSYGRMIVLDHGDGLTTLYAHASKLLVQEGDEVRAGARIAEVGRSGNARGTHLHFEVRRDGRPIDPAPFLRGPSRITAGAH